MRPIVAEFGGFTIYSYGVMVAAAFLIGIYIAGIESVRKGIKKDLVYDLAFYVTISAILSARIYYIAFYDPGLFIKDPLSVLKIWQGGLAVHGAILGGMAVLILFAKIRKISFWKLSDLMAPSVLFGQGIGRIGCFLNGCCYGVPTEGPLGVRFPADSLASIEYGNIHVHPAQLYESVADIIGFFMLWSVRKKIKTEGGLFLLYLMIYAGIRITVSCFRGDSLYIWNTNLKIAQVISGVIFVTAFAIFLKKQKHG
jgi:phosphatidylglycerol---prolipoprotein diacylglyceryl transferase